MKRRYSLTIKTPRAGCEAKGETEESLIQVVRILKCSTGDVEVRSVAHAQDEVEELVRKARGTYTRVTHTTLAKADIEADVARCFVEGMTLETALAWLKENRSFTGSRSAVGRYYRRLFTVASERMQGQLDKPHGG